MKRKDVAHEQKNKEKNYKRKDMRKEDEVEDDLETDEEMSDNQMTVTEDSDEDGDGIEDDDDDDDDDEDEVGSGDDDNENDDDDSNLNNKENNVKISPRMLEDSSDEPPTKIAKTVKKGLYKPPTNEELSQLRETENLYHSNLFRMQISELLKEVTMQERRKKQMEATFQLVKDMLQNLPASKISDIPDTEFKGVSVPMVQIPEKVKGKFQFVSPADVRIVGSFLLNTCVKPHVTMDVAVTIPKVCLQAKDYLNQRYLRKRALYLANIAKHLKKKPQIQDIKFTYHHGNHYKPILVLHVKGEHGKPVLVHIHVTPEETAFKLCRFHINKNNIRREWYHGKPEKMEDQEINTQPSTPVYNTAVLQDLILYRTTDTCMQTFMDLPAIKEGIKLLKVWLRQRQLDVGYGGFSGFIMTMYVVYLLSRRHLNKTMSNYQIMRNTLLNLSKSNWITDGITLCTDRNDSQRPLLSDFQKLFDVVFVDSSGYVNLCAAMNKSCFTRVKHEAELAVQMLESREVDSFSSLFMSPLSFYRKFDHILHISHLNCLKRVVKKYGLENKLMDFGGHYVYTVLPKVLYLLEESLKERISLLQVKQELSPLWSVSESPPKCEDQEKLTVGLMLNPECSTSVMDKGPKADSVEATEFRNFWGEISQLRRFIDGSICEAVIWMETTVSLSEKRQVCSKITKHVLNRHLGLPTKSLTSTINILDCVLQPPEFLAESEVHYGTGEEQHVNLMRSYDNLCKLLRNLDSLPLKINSVQGTAPAFRHSEVFPAVPSSHYATGNSDQNRYLPSVTEPCPVYTHTHHIVCMLEGSGKWPDDKDAFLRMKAAFHINLGEVLSRKHNLLVRVQPSYVDVRKDGYIFRVELAYIREIALRKMQKSHLGMVTWKDTDDSLELERRIQHLPKITSLLHGVHQVHNTYSGAVRLAKRWVSAQLLCDHIPEEVVDLLVAYVYVSPAPFTVPNSPLVGFLRFLYLLGHHDWKMTPLIVNLNEEFTHEDIIEVQTNFSKERNQYPVMFIATPSDSQSSHWTKKSPTAPILQRLILLSRESLAVLESQMSSIGDAQDYKQIFRAPLEVFDVVIHLYSKHVARRFEAVDFVEEVQDKHFRQKQAYSKCDSSKFPVYSYDPVQLYVQELRDAFDDYALFFCDKYGGSLIGVIWKPQALCKKEFKVSHVAGRMPETISTANSKDVFLVPNWEAILADFRVLGEGLVKSVEAKTEKWDV